MINSSNNKSLPNKNLFVSVLKVFIISSLIANLHNHLMDFIYTFGDVLSLVFLSCLFQDSWNSNY